MTDYNSPFIRFEEEFEPTDCICGECGFTGYVEDGRCEICGYPFNYVHEWRNGTPVMES